MMRDRVLNFVQSVEPLQGGGLGRAAIELNKQFNSMGLDSTLIATKDRGFDVEFEYVDQYVRFGPDFLYFPLSIYRDIENCFDGVSCVHGHGFYVGTNLVFGRTCRKLNIPLVYHVHGMFEPWIINRSAWKKKIVHILFENFNFKYASLWRALTNKEADQIRALGISAPIVVSPNGIHLDQFDSVSSFNNDLKTKNRILFLGRIHPKKGLDLLVSAWSGLVGLAREWEIVIAGPDEGGHQDEIQSLICDNQLDDFIRFVGPVSGDDKVRLLKSADVFILPSYSEGFSVAILEAMACRIPVIATDACNFPEIATEGGGWVCPASVEGVKDALKDAILCGENERISRGLLGRELVEAKYQWEQIATEIINASHHYCR